MSQPAPLDEDAIRRYSRQILLREVGGRGQRRILAAEMTLIGGGDALEIAAQYLARSGVSRLALHASSWSAQRLDVLARLERPSPCPVPEPQSIAQAPVDLQRLCDGPGEVLLGSWSLAGERGDLCWALISVAGVWAGRGADALAALRRHPEIAGAATAPPGPAGALVAGSAVALGLLQGLLGLDRAAQTRLL